MLLPTCYKMASTTEPKLLPAPENASSLSPSEAREIFKVNKYYMSTSGFCQGYVQANLAVVPESCADEFEEFCRRNPGPLPLLYRSKPGERRAPPLAESSDVKTDLPRYLIYNKGRQVSEMLDLDGFDWTGKVSFYTGCSFSFEKPLSDAGVFFEKPENNKGVYMYKTNINCFPVSDKLKDVKVIVSMRPIKKEDLQKAFSITSCYPVCGHGAPIHIGDPSKIGLLDLNTTIDLIGNLANIGHDKVPVFWACGVTVKAALEALGGDLSFTHYPSSMFITDIPTSSMKVEPLSQDEIPQIIQLSTSSRPYWASATTSKVLKKLQALENAILDDPSSCGVREMREEGDFVKAVLSLSHAKSVAIVFGFPCNANFPILEETDGPPGAFAIGQALQSLGKKVAIVSEKCNKELVEKCSEYLVNSGALKNKFEFISCSDFSSNNGLGYDALVAIERVGEASDGGHYSSKGHDLTSLLEPIDSLFDSASHVTDHVITIGIGDRGNELGLGKVRDRVVNVMKDGDKLGCAVASDRVILAGVSNWGGYAIAVGLYLLTKCNVHWRYVNYSINYEEERDDVLLDQFLTTDDQAKGVLSVLNEMGVVDGISKSMDQSVDGLPLEVHLDKLRELRSIAKN